MSDLTVLLVDDEEDFLEVLSGRLVNRGVNALSATSGEEALQILKRLAVDVVVLDVGMPGMSGVETLAEIRKDNRHDTEVIMLTGRADMDMAIESMKLGAFDFLIKPVGIDDLNYRIQDAYKLKVLKGSKEEAGAEA